MWLLGILSSLFLSAAAQCTSSSIYSMPFFNTSTMMANCAPLSALFDYCAINCTANYNGAAALTQCIDENTWSASVPNCIPNLCPITTVSGYITSCSPSASYIAANCVPSACAPNYYQNNVLQSFCYQGANMSFTGCAEKTCPVYQYDGYVSQGSTVIVYPCSGTIGASNCTNVVCAAGYYGVASVSCDGFGSSMKMTGCTPNRCLYITNFISSTYAVPSFNYCFNKTEAECTINCASSEYSGAHAECLQHGGNFTIKGCVKCSFFKSQLANITEGICKSIQKISPLSVPNGCYGYKYDRALGCTCPQATGYTGDMNANLIRTTNSRLTSKDSIIFRIGISNPHPGRIIKYEYSAASPSNAANCVGDSPTVIEYSTCGNYTHNIAVPWTKLMACLQLTSSVSIPGQSITDLTTYNKYSGNLIITSYDNTTATSRRLLSTLVSSTTIPLTLYSLSSMQITTSTVSIDQSSFLNPVNGLQVLLITHSITKNAIGTFTSKMIIQTIIDSSFPQYILKSNPTLQFNYDVLNGGVLASTITNCAETDAYDWTNNVCTTPASTQLADCPPFPTQQYPTPKNCIQIWTLTVTTAATQCILDGSYIATWTVGDHRTGGSQSDIPPVPATFKINKGDMCLWDLTDTQVVSATKCDNVNIGGSAISSAKSSETIRIKCDIVDAGTLLQTSWIRITNIKYQKIAPTVETAVILYDKITKPAFDGDVKTQLHLDGKWIPRKLAGYTNDFTWSFDTLATIFGVAPGTQAVFVLSFTIEYTTDPNIVSGAAYTSRRLLELTSSVKSGTPPLTVVGSTVVASKPSSPFDSATGNGVINISILILVLLVVLIAIILIILWRCGVITCCASETKVHPKEHSSNGNDTALKRNAKIEQAIASRSITVKQQRKENSDDWRDNDRRHNNGRQHNNGQRDNNDDRRHKNDDRRYNNNDWQQEQWSDNDLYSEFIQPPKYINKNAYYTEYNQNMTVADLQRFV